MILRGRLRAALARLNPDLPDERARRGRAEAPRARVAGARAREPAAPPAARRRRRGRGAGGRRRRPRRAGSADRLRRARTRTTGSPSTSSPSIEGQAHRRPDVVALRQRPAARRRRAEEPGRRGRDDLERATTSSRPTSTRSRRCSRTTRCSSISDGVDARLGIAHRREGAVPALADDRRRRRSRRAGSNLLEVLVAGRLREGAAARPRAPLHRLRGRRRERRSRRSPATTSSTPSRKAVETTRRGVARRTATGGPASSGTRRARARA